MQILYSRRIHCFSEQVEHRNTDSVEVILMWDMIPKQNKNAQGAMTIFFTQSNFTKSTAEKELFQITKFFPKINIRIFVSFFSPFAFNCQYISHQVFFCETPISILIYLTLISIKGETVHWQEIMYFANNVPMLSTERGATQL